MKIKLISIAMIMALSAGFNATAADIDDATMDIERSEFKRGNKMKMRIGSIVRDYMLEQGDITQGEIDLKKIEREQNREEIKALKEAGDTEGLAAKKAELKEQRKERREEIKEYIENNAELKAEIEEKRQEIKERRAERRENRKQRRSELTDNTTEG